LSEQMSIRYDRIDELDNDVYGLYEHEQKARALKLGVSKRKMR